MVVVVLLVLVNVVVLVLVDVVVVDVVVVPHTPAILVTMYGDAAVTEPSQAQNTKYCCPVTEVCTEVLEQSVYVKNSSGDSGPDGLYML